MIYKDYLTFLCDSCNLNDKQAVTMLIHFLCNEAIAYADMVEQYEVMNKAFLQKQNCVKCEHYYETEEDTGVHGHCSATCSNNAQVDKLRKAAEETEDNGVRKGILKAIEVLEGKLNNYEAGTKEQVQE